MDIMLGLPHLALTGALYAAGLARFRDRWQFTPADIVIIVWPLALYLVLTRRAQTHLFFSVDALWGNLVLSLVVAGCLGFRRLSRETDARAWSMVSLVVVSATAWALSEWTFRVLREPLGASLSHWATSADATHQEWVPLYGIFGTFCFFCLTGVGTYLFFTGAAYLGAALNWPDRFAIHVLDPIVLIVPAVALLGTCWAFQITLPFKWAVLANLAMVLVMVSWFWLRTSGKLSGGFVWASAGVVIGATTGIGAWWLGLLAALMFDKGSSGTL